MAGRDTINNYKEVNMVDVLIVKWEANFKLSKQTQRVTHDEDVFFATETCVYPYDYMDAPNKFNGTELPSKYGVKSKRVNESNTDQDYERAQQVGNDAKPWMPVNITSST